MRSLSTLKGNSFFLKIKFGEHSLKSINFFTQITSESFASIKFWGSVEINCILEIFSRDQIDKPKKLL